jgi:hypothetical protein
MNARSYVLAGLLAMGASLPAYAAGGPPAAPPPPPVGAPPAGAPGADDPETLGLRYLDEAARWIAKGENPPAQLLTMHADLEYVYDDGQNPRDERRMELWFRNADAFRADTQYAGRDSTLLMVGERGYLIRDRIRITPLNESATMKELLPMMRNYRDILREVGRLMAPAGLKSAGARFRFLGTVADPRATGGQWFKVLRTAPREGDMTFFFGSVPRPDGKGMRAAAPDKLILGGPPGSRYAGDEYRLEEWVHESSSARNEQFRYPRKMRLYAIGLDPENKPTMRASINFLEINQPIDPALLADPFK